jgi:hypothetical protein
MSTIPDTPRNTGDGTPCGPFALGAPLYRPLWPSVIHIPEDRKKEPPTGYTGFKGKIADNEQFAEWIDVKADRNLAVWLGFQIDLNDELWVIVAIDVDNYDDKLGGSQLAELVKKLGPLPDTWVSSSRIDGISGIRYFRVRYDPNLRLRNVAEHIETIYFGWRYALVWPSVVEGRQYWWFPPGVLPDENGRAAWKPESGIPDPATFPELPKPWFDYILRTDVNAPCPGGAVTDAEVTGFVAEHDNPATPRPGALAAIVEDFHLSRNGQKKFEGRIVNRTDRNANQVFLNRHDAEFSSLCRVARGSLVGKFGATEGKERIEAASRQECEVRGEIFKLYDFEHNWRDAIRRALEKPFEEVYEQEFRPGKDFKNSEGSNWFTSISLIDKAGNVVRVIHIAKAAKAGDSDSIFKVLGPTEWAKSVDPVAFLIPGALCDDTFGVNGGPKKSLKTHDNIAIAFSVAGNLNLYLSDKFPIDRSARVLYIVGEGGEVPVRRTLHRMARAYGLDLGEIQKDPNFPLTVAFGAAPLNSEPFKDEVRGLLDTYQPELVLLESFYNFHPQDVETSNLFERGPLIDSYHKFIRTECQGATSIITDHFRSTAINKSLDLDNISMAGQAENADSWILRNHRKSPNVKDGDFWLQTEFGSRQWSGTEWHVDWHLGEFDFALGCHVGEISWDVSPAKAQGDKPTETEKFSFAHRSEDDIVAHIRSHVQNRPQQTMSQLQQSLMATTDMTRKQVKEMWAKAQHDGWIHTKSIKRDEIDPKTSNLKPKTREVWFAGQGPQTLIADRGTWGV